MTVSFFNLWKVKLFKKTVCLTAWTGLLLVDILRLKVVNVCKYWFIVHLKFIKKRWSTNIFNEQILNEVKFFHSFMDVQLNYDEMTSQQPEQQTEIPEKQTEPPEKQTEQPEQQSEQPEQQTEQPEQQPESTTTTTKTNEK